MAKLKRSLGFFEVTVAGVGIILGAGIYALLGVASGYAGNATWLAFLISAFVALFTGLSYAELSSQFKGDGGEYDYVKATMGKKLALFAGICIIFAGIISAATVSLGFAGYFAELLPMPLLLGAVILILLMGLINFMGIKQASWFNTLSTSIEFIGLVIIILIGIKYWGSVDYMEMPSGWKGVFSSGALVFFAYMGFEAIIKLREETKNPEKTIPRALITAILVTAVVYVLVAISAISVMDWQTLSASNAPLAAIAASALGSKATYLLVIIALFSTANTVLLTMIAASRQMYGMAKEGGLPEIFADVHGHTRTPWVSIVAVMILIFVFASIGDIEIVANITNVLLFLVFAAVNLSLIIMRLNYKKPDLLKLKKKGHFICPLNVGKFPIIPLLGLLSSLGMMLVAIFNLI